MPHHTGVPPPASARPGGPRVDWRRGASSGLPAGLLGGTLWGLLLGVVTLMGPRPTGGEVVTATVRGGGPLATLLLLSLLGLILGLLGGPLLGVLHSLIRGWLPGGEVARGLLAGLLAWGLARLAQAAWLGPGSFTTPPYPGALGTSGFAYAVTGAMVGWWWEKLG